MKKVVIFFVLAILLVSSCFVMVGCSSNPLIGKWTNSDSYFDSVLEFFEDGTAITTTTDPSVKEDDIYAWEYDKKTKTYYIWANWPGAYWQTPEKMTIIISDDKKSISFFWDTSLGTPNGALGTYTK